MYRKLVEKNKDYIINIRRYIHQYPELSKKEFNTQKYIIEQLDNLGIYNYKIAGTGVIGKIYGEGYKIGIRGDMDGLPIEEKSNKNYKSKNKGISHCCGHDGHMAVVLGVAKILIENKNTFKESVTLLFQPDEEDTGGAKAIIKEGGIKNLDFLFGGHLDPSLSVGDISYRHGIVNASSDTFNIEIIGESAHGAYPEKSRDSIVIMSHLIITIQSIVSRNLSPLENGVISIGTISGGNVYNQIAGETKITGTIRTLDNETREKIKKRLIDICDGTEKTFNVEINFKLERGYDCLVNGEISKKVEKMFKKTYDMEKIIYKIKPSLGVEDFAYYAKEVPAMFLQFGCKIDGIEKFLHNEKFDFDEKALLEMTNYYLNCIKAFGGVGVNESC